MTSISVKQSVLSTYLASKRDRPSANSAQVEQDLLLVEQAQAGDMDAFRRLVEKYQDRARSIAFSISKNAQDAEDIAQDAFVKVYKNLSLFRGQSSFYTWFYRIVTNLAIDLSRKRYRKSETSVGEAFELDLAGTNSSEDSSRLVGEIAEPDLVLERKRMLQSISEAVDALSPEHRAVIMLREIDGLSYTEISETLNCSKGTVMSRLHHARKKLQRSLHNYKNMLGEL
jgi:RNA polymerase sigma-70 factor (ECF subfamily)